MRVYLATTPEKLSELLRDGSVGFAEYLTPAQFEFPQEVGEEEQEDLIAQLAADDSGELNGGKIRLVLAADLTDEQLTAETLKISFSDIAALLVGEELSWFAPEEIAHELSNWISS